MKKTVKIKKDSKIEIVGKEMILVDGKPVLKKTVSSVLPSLLDLLLLYKEKATTKKSFQVDLQACYRFFDQYNYIMDTFRKGNEHERIKKRFSFLNQSPYFKSIYETDLFCFYEFKDENYGEAQFIYIVLPKKERYDLQFHFQYIRDGQVEKLFLNQSPDWIFALYEKTQNEVEKMHRLRKIFLEEENKESV